MAKTLILLSILLSWPSIQSATVLRGESQNSRVAPIANRAQAGAQDRASALATVALFRRDAMGDSVRIQGCSAIAAVGDSVAIQRVLASDYSSASLFGTDANGCAAPSVSSARGLSIRQRRVKVDSILLRQDSASVFATVSAPEHIHRERFMLVRLSSRDPWGVVEMRVYGILRLH